MRKPQAVRLVCVALWLLVGAPAGLAQTSGDLAKAVVGAWELSNADRDRNCTVNLKATTSGPGFALEWERKCAEVFPFTREASAWKIGAREALQLIDAKGQTILELTEVESGLYEGERPGQGLFFLQNVAGGAAEERKPEQLVGDWAFLRGAGRPLCQITLTNTPAAQDTFALRVKPGCDPTIVRFGPVAWRLDRGQLVLIPARGEGWRFEESDSVTWRRIPEGRNPLQLVRQ